MTTDAQTISLAPAITYFNNLVQGNSLSFKITLTDDNGDPIDITTDDAAMDIKRLDGTLTLALTVGDGITFTDPGNGEMTIAIEAADTVSLDPDYTYEYDVRWISGTSVRTLAYGTIDLFKRITD